MRVCLVRGIPPCIIRYHQGIIMPHDTLYHQVSDTPDAYLIMYEAYRVARTCPSSVAYLSGTHTGYHVPDGYLTDHVSAYTSICRVPGYHVYRRLRCQACCQVRPTSSQVRVSRIRGAYHPRSNPRRPAPHFRTRARRGRSVSRGARRARPRALHKAPGRGPRLRCRPIRGRNGRSGPLLERDACS